MKNSYEYHASQSHVNGKKKAIKIRIIVAFLCLFLGMMGITGIFKEYEIGLKSFWPVLEVYAEEEEEEEEDTDPNHIYLLDGRLMVVDIGSGASENIGYYSQWAGKRVAWYGDSLTELYYHCSLVNQYFGLAAYNCGTRGATVSTHTVSALCTKIRMKLYIGYIPSDVEAIFIMAGTNDWMQNVPLGTKILTRDVTGAVNTDSTTFYGACHLMFSHLRELYPNAKIVVFGTPMAMNADGLYNALGLSAADYGDAMCEIANMWGIENFNIGECIQVNITNCGHGDGYMYEQLHFLEIPSRRAADAIIQKLCTTPYQEGR